MFFSNKSRININHPIKFHEENEDEFLSKTIDRNRIMVIRAAIVRIMKMNQNLTEKSLIEKVLEQLNSRFSCQISSIKVNNFLHTKIHFFMIICHLDMY